MMILLSIVVLAAAMYGACRVAVGVFLHPPAMSSMSIFPEQFSLRYEKIAFRTRDGIELKGWFIPSKSGDSRTIIMCHGWGDNKGELLRDTNFLGEHGVFNLMYFDFRSHGESGGEITTSGGLETIDFDAAVAWLQATKPELAKRVGVFGLSMGASVTLVSLPKHPDLRCATLESPFADYNTVVGRWVWNKARIPYYPLVALTLAILRARLNSPEIDGFDPIAAAAQITPRPLFVISGECDRLMTPGDVRRVFDAAREPKELWMVPEARHAKCRETAGAAYDARVTEFFARNL